MTGNISTDAFMWGLISAATLPLGALLSFIWKPKSKIIAAMMAFGGGALLSALTIDLVAESLKKGEFFPLSIGCIAGGFLYIGLNMVVNSKGGFLRKAATSINYLKRKKIKSFERLSDKLGKVPLFNMLPPEEIQSLLPYISNRTYQKGSVLITQGEPGDSLFIIEKGNVDIIDEKNNSQKIATLKENDVVGEMALVTGEPRSATARAASDTKVWIVLKEHFDKLIQTSPVMAAEVKNIVSSRIGELKSKNAIDTKKAEEWSEKAIKNISQQVLVPTETEIKEAAAEHSGAPLAIWIGILLDGIPESLVIGTSLLNKSTMSISLIAGLFLSNFPEALSSSVGMKQQNYSKTKIFWMWASLMIITGIGAYCGNAFFADAPHFLFALIEGTAAGAMLTMIAETMLPEAFHKGGSVTGLSTLFGFLAAIFFKTLE